MPPMATVSVIVPARDASATIGRALEAIAAQDIDDEFEVIVVDDGSRDDTVAIATAAGARVLTQEGRGPGEARNLGADQARGAILAFTDADCFPDSGWLAEGLRAMDGCDLVQGRVEPDPTAVRRPFDHTIWVVRESGLYETANLFVRRSRFVEVGGFEDWLEVGLGKRLGEDVWLGWKLRRAGARSGFAAAALVHHAVLKRRWHEFVLERRRLVYFPDLVRKVPELRRHFLRARLFVTVRSAVFAAAVVGVAATGALAAAGAPAAAWLATLGLGLPYLWLLARRAIRLGPHAPKVTAVETLADIVGFAALVWGSVRRRTVVL